MILHEDENKVLLLIESKGNSKTGPIPTLWGFVPRVMPREALRTGMDAAICGNCVHRGYDEDEARCYTHKGNTFHGLANIVKKHARGGYPVADQEMLLAFLTLERKQGAKALRSMGYGDMGLFPQEVWENLDDLRRAAKLTVRGYTQQWRRAPWLRDTHMASVTNALQAAEAESLGWRTFWTVKPKDLDKVEGRLNCPASKEQGKLTTCNDCSLCYGARRAPSVWIKEH